MPLATIDFETEAIEHAPAWLPPRPVGVAIHKLGESKYMAWGHPSENNCTREEAIAELRSVWNGEIIFHNGMFDVSVATHHLGLPWPEDPLKIHDTMFLLFLLDPYAKTFALKPSAERYLGMVPVERDLVVAYVLANVPGATVKGAGAHISKVPGGLVGRYAIGDVVRTRALFDYSYHKVAEAGMLKAYQREQRLMPIIAAGTKRGIHLDAERLDEDRGTFEIALTRVTNAIFRMLGQEFTPDSDMELGNILEQRDAVTEWVLTETGKKSVARKNLHLKPEFAPLRELLDYRGVLNTCLSTFVKPWLALSSVDGLLHPEWNQTRGDRDKDNPNGTRTGRLSCSSPNFQNVPNISEVFVPKGLPPLPNMRSYIIPPEGYIWLKRDFSAQEMRIMAHFAEGKLYEAYRKDPNVDPHEMVKGLIKELLNLDIPRKHVKTTGFGIMYGMGIQKLADSLGVDYDRGRLTKESYFTALPEVKTLAGAVKRRGTMGEAIRTWGGRCYYKEQHPSWDLSYKLLNYLIQGSAADQTKESIIDWECDRKSTDIFQATVHDEINIAVPIEDQAGGMFRLRMAMDADRFDVPFRSEGFAGLNWSDIKEYEA